MPGSSSRAPTGTEPDLSRVEINAGGRHIIVDHDGTDLAYVVEKAEKLWEAADSRAVPPVGFHADANGNGPAPRVGQRTSD